VKSIRVFHKKKGFFPDMEIQQIQDFVHRVSADEILREELARDSEKVIKREAFSPRVANVVLRLVPHLALDKAEPEPSFCWWNYC
jgi:hypothetical protein